MSEGTQNIGDEQPVVGEPASHPHQAVVVGEPPEDVTPVLGEPAFANGLQDQQPISPSSVNWTSANGAPAPPTPFHEESSVSSSHVSAPSSAPPVEESPDFQQVLVAEASESGIEEGVTHQLEASVAENACPHVDDVSSASTYVESPSIHDTARSVEEEHATDFPDVVEVTHIDDSPSEVPLHPSEVPSENPFAALDEGQTDENAPGEILAGDTPVTDGAAAASASCPPDDISSKGPGDQQEETSLSSAVQEKQSTEHLAFAQIDVDDGPLEGSKAVHEQVGQGDALAQASDANVEEEETGSSVVEHPLAPELDQAIERDAFVQGNDRSEDIPAKSEEVEHVLNREVPESEVSTIESSTPQKGTLNENHAAPIASESQSNEETLNEAPPAAFSVAPEGTRESAVEERLVNHQLTEETYFPPAANGNNGYQHCEDGDRAVEREQDLPKDDDASAEVEKSSSRIKLPLIFTGLAIAAVGVAVASINRTH